MEFENVNIQNLVSEFSDFAVEGFNIFALGKDDLPHLICVCPNKSFAWAVQSLLTIAKRAQDLRTLNMEITSDCYLSPLVLADGKTVLVATVIDDAVLRNGSEVEYEEPEIRFGGPEYESFVRRFLDLQEKEGRA